MITSEATIAFWSAVDDTLFYFRHEQRERDFGRMIDQSSTLYRLRPEEQPQVWLTLPNWLRPTAGLSGLWYVAEEQLWLLSYDADKPQVIRPLPGIPQHTPAYLSPDEALLVTYCDPVDSPQAALCLTTTALSAWQQPLPETTGTAVALSWRPDGRMLALAHVAPRTERDSLSGSIWLYLYDLASTGEPLPRPRRIQVVPARPDAMVVSEPDWPHLLRVDPPAGVDILGWLPDGERPGRLLAELAGIRNLTGWQSWIAPDLSGLCLIVTKRPFRLSYSL